MSSYTSRDKALNVGVQLGPHAFVRLSELAADDQQLIGSPARRVRIKRLRHVNGDSVDVVACGGKRFSRTTVWILRMARPEPERHPADVALMGSLDVRCAAVQIVGSSLPASSSRCSLPRDYGRQSRPCSPAPATTARRWSPAPGPSARSRSNSSQGCPAPRLPDTATAGFEGRGDVRSDISG
jgi:hypothetical protein